MVSTSLLPLCDMSVGLTSSYIPTYVGMQPIVRLPRHYILYPIPIYEIFMVHQNRGVNCSSYRVHNVCTSVMLTQVLIFYPGLLVFVLALYSAGYVPTLHIM